MPSQTTNSAKQLYQLLERASQQDPEKSVSETLALILNVDSNNPYAISQSLEKLFVLFNDTRSEIKYLENSRIERYLNVLDKIENALLCQVLASSNPNLKWNSIKIHLREEWLDLIAASAELLESQKKEFLEIAPQEIEQLLITVRELIDEVKNLDLDRNTKSFLIQQLRKIEDSFFDYHIRGSAGVEKVEKEVFGRIISEIAQNENLKKAERIVRKVLQYVVEIDKIVRAGEHLEKLPHFIDKLLPPHQ